MASVARTGQLRRRTRLVPVPVPVEDSVTLVVRDIQQNILHMQKQYECPICLELIAEPRATDCGHYFCKQCILQYITLSSKKPPIKCPLCKETVTKRSLVECSNMGDISRAIRQLIEGFHLDTGTTVSTPYVGNVVNSNTTDNTVLASSTPKKKIQIGTKQKESSGGDKIETLEFEKLEVKATQCNNETETETNKEDASAKSEQLDTGLENKIKGSTMKSRSLSGTKFSGKLVKINGNKKTDFSNMISDILGISETISFDQSNTSTISFLSGKSIPLCSSHDGTNHDMELQTGTNNIDMKTPVFSSAKGFEFASSKKLLENKTNSFDNQKLSNLELNEDEYRSKRLKSGTENNSMVSFVPGISLLGAANAINNLEQTETDTKNFLTNETSLMSITSDIYSATTESLSGLADFSPIKYPNNHNLNETYDIIPTPISELSSQQVETNFSSTLQLTSTKSEEYIYDGNILEMTFSDNFQNETNNTGTETHYEEEITLKQFLTQRPFYFENKDSFPLSPIPEIELEERSLRNETNSHSNNATLQKDVTILEPSYLGVNRVKFQDDSVGTFSIEMSKDLVSINQTKFEMELKELISETETLDSLIFTQPYITECSLPNQNIQEDTQTQYTLMDIFSPIQQNTSSPKLTHSQHSNLSTTESGIGAQTLQNLANESLENFNNSLSTMRVANSQSEMPVLPQNKDEFQCAPMVAMVAQNSQPETTIPERDDTLNFSRFSELFQTGSNAIIGSNSFSHRISDSYMEDVPFMEVRN